LIATACLIPLLCACASVKPVTLTTGETAATFRSRSLDDAGLRRFATQAAAAFLSWPPERWDARALDVAALYFNPSLAVARARWQVADAAVGTAREIPNPTLNIAPQYVSNAMTGVPAWFVASSLIQIIETAGKREFRVARARYLSEAARLDALDSAWQTVGAVNGALLDIGAAQRRITALDRQIAAQSALTEIAEKRIQAGLGSSLELTAARTALNKASLDRETSRTALIEAQHQLAQAVGVSAEAIPLDRLSAILPGSAPPPDFRKRVREDAILNRADLLARLADYAASDAALQLELARQYPDVQIGPGYEYDQGDRKWGLSLALPIPIFNQNQGAIGEALAHRRQAADEFFAVQARVIGDIDREIDAYDSAARTFGVADDLFRRQTAQVRAQQAMFDRGETDRAELLAARVELANADLAKTDAEGNWAKARLALELVSQHSLNGFVPGSLIITAGS
jgi:outer membrane protein TolC